MVLVRLLLALVCVLPALSSPALAAPSAVPSVTDPRMFVGANVPWFNWACDFGCGAKGGVSAPSTRAALADGFGKLKSAGVHVVRWWTFEGDPAQINRDAGGPTKLSPAVYDDFDAALALADQYDLVYDFVLFSAPTALPRAWVTDPTQRQRLANVLAPLFERYKNNPRILSWEIVNEPEWDLWNDKIPQAPVQDTVKLLASTIHAHTATAVTVGSASLEGVPLWAGLGLDFYSPHWYDPMSSGVACARCTDAPTVTALYRLNGTPIVLGEFYAGPDTDALQRLTDFRAKGYAGAWAWSLFSDKTSDKMRVDFAAVASFTAGRGASPTAVPPAPTNPDIRLLTSWVTPTYTSPGQDITFHQDVQSGQDTVVLVDFEVYDDKGARISQTALSNQALTANSPTPFSITATLPASLGPGQYTVKTGVFSPDWATLLAWSDSVGSFVLDTSSVPTPEPPAVDAPGPDPGMSAPDGPVPNPDAPPSDA